MICHELIFLIIQTKHFHYKRNNLMIREPLHIYKWRSRYASYYHGLYTKSR